MQTGAYKTFTKP